MISVIMLTYNRETLVGRAIESVRAQSWKDLEFIIVDNGSTDRSGKIADEYAALDSRIQVIHKECGNIGSGRNAGLNAAKGDFIAFIDDDDWIEPDYLDFLYQLLVEYGADVSICGTTTASSEKHCVMTAEEAVIETMRQKLFKVGFPGKLFRSSVIGNLRFPTDTIHDDCFLMHKALGNASRVAYDGILKYHIFHGSSSTTKWKDDFRLLTPELLTDLLESRKLRTEWCGERFPNSALLFQYFEWSYMISMVEKINRLHVTQCSRILDVMVQELSAHKNEFLSCEYCQPFERQWVEQYIS